MREVQDGIEESKQGSGRARRREGVDQGHLGRGNRGPGPRTKGPSKSAGPQCWVVDQEVQGDQG